MCYLVSYDDKEMTLQWHKKDPVTVSDKIQIPSYTLTSHEWYASTEDFTTGTILLIDLTFNTSNPVSLRIFFCISYRKCNNTMTIITKLTNNTIQ